MTDTKDLIREIQEHTAAHGGENTATHLLVQAVMALQRQADEMAAIGAGGVSGPLLGRAALAAPQQAAPAMPSEIALMEKAARRVGITSLLNHGAASCVYSEGCAGVSQEHLLAYTREIALHCAVALAAPQQEVPGVPYSIDADPQGIRATVADAITGALAFGAQGANMPPTGHWLAPFWESARQEASRNAPVTGDTLYLLRRLLSNQHTLTGSEFRAELGKIVEDAHAATPPAQPAPSGDAELPVIKGASITGGYVVVTPAGWANNKAATLRDAILRTFPVNAAYTPNPDAARKEGK